MFSNKPAAIGVICLALSALSCREANSVDPGTETSLEEVNAPVSQIRERGYFDAGNGVFMIPGSSDYDLRAQIAFARAVSNFREDHPELEITMQIKIDRDDPQWKDETLEGIDGVLLLTEERVSDG